MVNDRHCFLAMERRILVLFFSSSSMVGMEVSIGRRPAVVEGKGEERERRRR